MPLRKFRDLPKRDNPADLEVAFSVLPRAKGEDRKSRGEKHTC